MPDFQTQVEAFHWIVGILKSAGIPYRVTGGLAAQSYGAVRPLVDIDFDFPEDRFNEFLSDVRPYICFGPARHHDDAWDLELLQLNYRGQIIELGGIHAQIFDKKTNIWVSLNANLAVFEERKVFGISVPVIPKNELIYYKSILSRVVDREDIAQIC